MADSRCRGVQRSWVVVMKWQRGLESSCYDVKGRWWVVGRRRKGVSMSLGGRLQWSSQTFPDHARLPPTVFTTTERPPNDLWRPLNVPTRPTFIPDHSRLFWTVQNSREHRPSLPTSQDLTRPATALFRPTKDLTRPFQTIKVGRGRPPSRLQPWSHLVDLEADLSRPRWSGKVV